MKFIKWYGKYNIHIKEIDKQHQHFVELINQLYGVVVDEKSPKEEVARILNEVVDYTDYHFKIEEELFEAHDYPDFEIHKQQHDALRKQILQLQKDFVKGHALINLRILTFMNEWFINHILDSDQEYAPYLKSKGVS